MQKYPVLFLLLSACGEATPNLATPPSTDASSDISNRVSPGNDTGPEGGPIERSGNALGALVCDRMADCCPGTGGACTATALLDGIFEHEGMRVDHAAFDACAAKIINANCETVALYGGRIAALDFCEPFLFPEMENGTPCSPAFGRYSCISGRCEKVCVPLAEVNEPCDTDSDCASTLACMDGTCGLPSAPGESCELTNKCSDAHLCYRSEGEDEHRCHPEEIIGPGESCGSGKTCSLGGKWCRCPPDDIGCSVGTCGDSARCIQ